MALIAGKRCELEFFSIKSPFFESLKSPNFLASLNIPDNELDKIYAQVSSLEISLNSLILASFKADPRIAERRK